MTKAEAYEAYWTAVNARNEAWKVYEKASAKTKRAQAREDAAFDAFSKAVDTVSVLAKQVNETPASGGRQTATDSAK